MSQQKYPKAYEAYQQAVYRDGRNPTFWCSIGVLYYQINQYRDALDAYSRAIRLNPYISEVWYDLGTLVRLPSISHRCLSQTSLTAEFSTSHATIKLTMPWTHTSALPSLTPPTPISRTASNSCAVARAAHRGRPALRYLKMFIPRRIKLTVPSDPLGPSGTTPRLPQLPRDLPAAPR